MAAGCAIVATDLPVFHEILTDADASWAPAQQPKALADAIRRSVENTVQAEALGQRMRHLAEEYYTWQARGMRLQVLLKTVAKSHHAGKKLQAEVP
jgi:glycosyltransferase involved in cell wall biosynthesis